LKQNGFYWVRIKGSRHHYTKEGFPTIPVPVHGGKDLAKGTEQNFLKMAGLK